MRRTRIVARIRAERETVIRFNELDEPAYLWSTSRIEARRWERLGLAVQGDRGCWRARCEKGWIRVRKPRRPLYGNEKRQEIAARLAKGREAKGRNIA